jgi:hypothetical protein
MSDIPNITETKEEKDKEKHIKNGKHKKNDDATYLNFITIDCLLNKKRYGSYLGYNSEDKKPKVSSKDKRFYRKRIQQITKDLLLEKEEAEPGMKGVECSNEIKDVFNTYISLCIRYFKTIDYNDINQDLIGVIELENDKSIIDIETNESDMDSTLDENELLYLNEKHLVRSINVKQPTLDGFVKKINTKVEEIIIPHKKNINLKEPSLKTKGIKKNITSNYEGQDEFKNEKT